jgi:methenyltetrahydrofolate cyclohydrolase
MERCGAMSRWRRGCRRGSRRPYSRAPNLSDAPFTQLLDDLADRTPAPGGGSAAAWATAIAAALVEMAAAFSDREVPALREQALALAERELSAYGPVLEAARLPKEDPERRARLDQALSEAADSPLEIARLAAQVEELARDLVAHGNRTLEGDAGTAAELAGAARRAAARLVEINLSARPDDPRAAEAKQLRR